MSADNVQVTALISDKSISRYLYLHSFGCQDNPFHDNVLGEIRKNLDNSFPLISKKVITFRGKSCIFFCQLLKPCSYRDSLHQVKESQISCHCCADKKRFEPVITLCTMPERLVTSASLQNWTRWQICTYNGV